MAILKFLVLLLIGGGISARAEWSVVSNQSEFSADRKVEHRHVTVKSDDGNEATMELASFAPKSATLRVIDDASANSSLAAEMQRGDCVAGVNGGYFDPDHKPIGLLMSDGRVIAPLQKARLLSGVVSATKGRVQIQRSAEFSQKNKPFAARQCGPFLVERGQPIVGLNETRSARRTFVATMANESAAIGYCSYVTLAQLAAVLAVPELKVQRALNLDGGSSSGFWFKGMNGVTSIREQKTVRDYLAIVPK